MSSLLRLVELNTPEQPNRLLVVTAALGTDVGTTWGPCAAALRVRSQVVGIDMPGTPGAPLAGESPLTIKGLSRAVVDVTKEYLSHNPALTRVPRHYAGNSLGGGIGLQLAVDHPTFFTSLAALCAMPQVGTTQEWDRRIASVRTSSIEPLVQVSRRRWFTPNSLANHSLLCEEALLSLRNYDEMSYIRLCEALRRFNVTPELNRISLPVLIVTGAEDTMVSQSTVASMAKSLPNALCHTVPGAAHLVQMEQPDHVAKLLEDFFSNSESSVH